MPYIYMQKKHFYPWSDLDLARNRVFSGRCWAVSDAIFGGHGDVNAIFMLLLYNNRFVNDLCITLIKKKCLVRGRNISILKERHCVCLFLDKT